MNFELKIDQTNSLLLSFSVTGFFLLLKTGSLVKEIFDSYKCLRSIEQGRIGELDNVMKNLKYARKEDIAKTTVGTINLDRKGEKWTGLVSGRLNLLKERSVISLKESGIKQDMITLVKDVEFCSKKNGGQIVEGVPQTKLNNLKELTLTPNVHESVLNLKNLSLSKHKKQFDLKLDSLLKSQHDDLKETIFTRITPPRINEVATLSVENIGILDHYLSKRDKAMNPSISLMSLVKHTFQSSSQQRVETLMNRFPNAGDHVEVKTKLSGVQLNLPVVTLLTINKFSVFSNKGKVPEWVGSLKHVGKSVDDLRMNLMKHIAKKSFYAGLCFLGLTVLGVGILVFATKKRNIKNLQNTFSNGSIVLENDENADILTCIVCYERKRCIYFRPCGHLVMCGVCFEKLKSQNKKCIVCKREVESWKIIRISK